MPSAWPDSRRSTRSAWAPLLRRSTCWPSRNPGKRNGWSASERPGIDQDHVADPGAAGLDVAGNVARAGKSTPLSKSEQAAAANWKATILKLSPERLRKRTRELLTPLLERLHQRGIQIVFFFPPLHPEVRGGIEAKITELQQPFVAELSRHGTVENFSLSMPSGIEPVFADSMHLQQDVAHAVLADIYLRNFANSGDEP